MLRKQESSPRPLDSGLRRSDDGQLVLVESLVFHSTNTKLLARPPPHSSESHLQQASGDAQSAKLTSAPPWAKGSTIPKSTSQVVPLDKQNNRTYTLDCRQRRGRRASGLYLREDDGTLWNIMEHLNAPAQYETARISYESVFQNRLKSVQIVSKASHFRPVVFSAAPDRRALSKGQEVWQLGVDGHRINVGGV